MNALTTTQEAQLVKRAQAGDQQAFSELVSASEARIYRVALQILRNEHEAEDAMQDGMLKAYEKLATFNGGSRFSTWVTRIVINECLMRLRSRNQHSFTSVDEPEEDGAPAMDLRDWDEDPEQRYSRQQLREILNEALAGLAEDYRVVVVLRDVEGLSNEETAQQLGISITAVKSRLLRGRMALRQRLSRHFLRRARTVAQKQQAISLNAIFASLVPLAAVAE